MLSPWLSILLNRCFLGINVPFIPPSSCSTYIDVLLFLTCRLRMKTIFPLNMTLVFRVCVSYKNSFNFMLAYLSCTVIFLYICPLGFKILRIVLHSFNSFSYSASPIFKKILLIYVQSNVKNIINSVYTIKTSTNNKSDF